MKEEKVGRKPKKEKPRDVTSSGDGPGKPLKAELRGNVTSDPVRKEACRGDDVTSSGDGPGSN